MLPESRWVLPSQEFVSISDIVSAAGCSEPNDRNRSLATIAQVNKRSNEKYLANQNFLSILLEEACSPKSCCYQTCVTKQIKVLKVNMLIAY